MFIYGNFPLKKTTMTRVPVKRVKDSRFIYLLMHSEKENDLRPGQMFNDYEMARKAALAMVKRKNQHIEGRKEMLGDAEIRTFSEIAPDLWTNEQEWIRINIMEIKNS